MKATITTGFITIVQEFPQNNTTLKYNLWETSGSELNNTNNIELYRNANAVFLVYSMICKESFDKLVNFWYPKLHENCPNVLIGVVGNKLDLYEKGGLTEEAKNFTEDIKGYYFQTSAKTNDGVETMFEKIGMKFLSLDSSLSFNTSNVTIGKKKKVTKCC